MCTNACAHSTTTAPPGRHLVLVLSSIQSIVSNIQAIEAPQQGVSTAQSRKRNGGGGGGGVCLSGAGSGCLDVST
jgi:hypothetical protein